MSKIAIDFGTTNTVVAVWREASGTAETLHLPGLSAPATDGQPPLVRSMLYVLDGNLPKVLAGQAVVDNGYDLKGDERLFTSFKRGIAASSRPLSREIDDALWADDTAGRFFLQSVLGALAEVEGPVIDELVLTVPIQSFEKYLNWLREETLLSQSNQGLTIESVRVVDESTAAALGYEVRKPGELILVFDFGGGSLDVSLVRMPTAHEGGGVILGDQPLKGQSQPGDMTEARVIAKAGAVLGGDDIDNWLLDEVLLRNEKSSSDIGASYDQLKQAVEAAKIRLSNYESAEISVYDPDAAHTYRATITRAQLETLLDQHDFYNQIQRAIDKSMRAARQRGIYPEDIGAVLMVGGSSLIPSVGRMLRSLFGRERILEHRPFEAVAHGALGLVTGLGLDDFLYHSYGIRHLHPGTNRHEYEEIITSGTRYPIAEPIEFILCATRSGQEAIELVIGEVEESTSSLNEVMFGERAILMVDGGIEMHRVEPLNDEGDARTIARLDPPGEQGIDRIRAQFTVDENRTLRVTVSDLKADRVLLHNASVIELR